MIEKRRVNEAVAYFESGFNCAQAVLAAYCEHFGLNKETALKISCGFGAGMGRRCEVCGAVSGAYMVIGLANGYSEESRAQIKEKNYAMVREFAERFERINKTTSCAGLLGVDLISGDKDLAKKQIGQVCPKMVRDAAKIIEEMLF